MNHQRQLANVGPHRSAAEAAALVFKRRQSLECVACPAIGRRLENRQFVDMERAFRLQDGLAASGHVLNLLRREGSDQPISRLARWIVAREVVNFIWQSDRMIPLFQFELSTMTLRPHVTAVARELRDVFDDWHLALWFSLPNAWLDDCKPVDIVNVDASAVFEAARADRFVACG